MPILTWKIAMLSNYVNFVLKANILKLSSLKKNLQLFRSLEDLHWSVAIIQSYITF